MNRYLVSLWARNRAIWWFLGSSAIAALLAAFVGGNIIQLPPIFGLGLAAPLTLWLSLLPIVIQGACLGRRPHSDEAMSLRYLRITLFDLFSALAGTAFFLPLALTESGMLGLRNVGVGSLLTLATSRLWPSAPASSPWVAWVLVTSLAGRGVAGPHWWAYPAQPALSGMSQVWTATLVLLIAATIVAEYVWRRAPTHTIHITSD